MSAVELAVKALELKPTSFEAYYARARAKRDDRCVIIFMFSLWYSCHELCYSLLTETPWIYRNLIGQETKPGHITDIAQGHDKQVQE